ncbi:transcription factor RF2b-like [Chenopodium quinoa]|uniref:transcription factor RF2b-like n=1 Tax=Chenopodium quinoa TaxID=63459 RepID=UPI000B78DF1C|nr:transcription factor RF2b-like [Chenopodium quinoa]
MGHRRVHSEILLRIPDQISFGGSMEGGDDADDLLATYMDMEKIEYFDDKQNDPMNCHDNAPQDHHHNNNNNQKPRHCMLVDEFSGISSNNDNDNNNDYSKISNNNSGIASCEAKKAMPPHKLAELWIADPKRAKRILANRQSAARSKERKARYMQELEKRVKSLQTEATALSVQLSLFKRDTTGLTNENMDLRRQLESMEQQAQLRDALNDALKQELDRLKAATGDTSNTADTFVMPQQNAPHHSQQQQHPHRQQQQQSSCPFDSNMLMSPHQIDSHNSKMSCLQPFEMKISRPSPALDSHQTEPIEAIMINMAQQPKVPQHFPIDRGSFLPFESSKPRVPQFCTNEANMSYPPQAMDSPLGNISPYTFESNSQSPEQEVYTTSRTQMLGQMPINDHSNKWQGLDINGLNSYHVKVEGPSIIANENMKAF